MDKHRHIEYNQAWTIGHGHMRTFRDPHLLPLRFRAHILSITHISLSRESYAISYGSSLPLIFAG